MYNFVVNKMAGNGKGKKVWKAVEPLLQRQQIGYHVEFSVNSAHAADLVRQLVAKDCNRTVLVIVGGDGTLQSVIPELIGYNVPLGIIPAGTGNDFARALGIPLHPKKALDYLFEGGIKKIDVAKTGDKYCLTVVGIGIDGKVAQTVNDSGYKKWFNFFRLGHLSYVLSLLQVLLRYRPVTATLKVDETEMTFSNVWLIAAANFPNYGGGMVICPGASYSDGVLDICIVHGISRFELVRVFPLVFKGKHISHSGVSILRGKEVKVVSSSPMIAHGDGEIIGQTPIEIDIRKEAVPVIFNG
ncbi:diacylglycerol/lipid kinase family protein [Paenibacillus alkalitolerans]|uniref:diacylglycerol/lipid kinase family protein n=1 Tax=Paenibacillus alkalitolerans TaxID=2799335 RepID=UPI0018F676BC|nr:diacylglycerol kinase family protein [Paenibacillus alkalitolerans]